MTVSLTSHLVLPVNRNDKTGCTEVGGHSHSVVNSAERLLRCVDHVQKSVGVFLTLVDLAQRRAVADQCAVIHEQVERFVWMKLKSATATEITMATSQTWCTAQQQSSVTNTGKFHTAKNK